jgi:hypothetical protein
MGYKIISPLGIYILSMIFIQNKSIIFNIFDKKKALETDHAI